MTKALKIPKEQRSFADHGGLNIDDLALSGDCRDDLTGVQSPQPGDADVNLGQQGRFGNIRQNMTTQWKTQAR